MSLSDCPKCWDTPCTCGYYWKDYSPEARKKQAEIVLGNKLYNKEEVELIIRNVFKHVNSDWMALGFISRTVIDNWIKENLK